MLEQFTPFADGLDHPEGVTVGPDGTLYAGGEAGQIYRVGTDGEHEQIADVDGGFLLGLAADADGLLYVCDTSGGRVARVDPRSGEVTTVTRGTTEAPLRTPNYLAFGPDGSLYVTDSGGFDDADGHVLRVRPDGTTEIWSDEVRDFPNGCCLSADGRSLLVVTSAPRPGVTRLPILADGGAGPPERVVDLPGTVPDGIAATADGELVVSCYRPDRILLVTADKRVEVLADDPRGVVLAAPTNVVFAGEQHDELIVASLARWHLTRGLVGLTGSPLHFPPSIEVHP